MAEQEALRLAAFREVRRLADLNGDLTSRDLRAGFRFDGERIPLINPQRGIFKPAQMQFLLSIRTVFPRPGPGSGTTIKGTCTARSTRATRRSTTPLWARTPMPP